MFFRFPTLELSRSGSKGIISDSCEPPLTSDEAVSRFRFEGQRVGSHHYEGTTRNGPKDLEQFTIHIPCILMTRPRDIMTHCCVFLRSTSCYHRTCLHEASAKSLFTKLSSTLTKFKIISPAHIYYTSQFFKFIQYDTIFSLMVSILLILNFD